MGSHLSMCKKLGELETDPRNFQYSKSGIYGTAHMMDEKEMKEFLSDGYDVLSRLV